MNLKVLLLFLKGKPLSYKPALTEWLSDLSFINEQKVCDKGWARLRVGPVTTRYGRIYMCVRARVNKVRLVCGSVYRSSLLDGTVTLHAST